MHETAAPHRLYRPPSVKNPIHESQLFYDSMRSRRSVRHFTNEAVPDQVIENAIKTAGTAPSGANAQPWFFAVIKTQAIKDKLRAAAEDVEQDFYQKLAGTEWLGDLAPLGTNVHKPHLSTSPVIIAVFTRHRPLSVSPMEMKRSYYPLESTGIAVGILLTALHKAGLATLTHTPRPMHFMNELLGLDQTYKPFLLVVTGYAGAPCMVPRIERKDLSAIAQYY